MIYRIFGHCKKNMKILYPYFWSDLKYKIRDFFFPRQKWLTNCIPTNYTENDDLVEIILFKILQEFVEVEIGKKELFDPDRWKNENNEWTENQRKFEEELKKHYVLLTQTLPELQKKEDEEWEKIPPFSLNEITSGKWIANNSYKKTYNGVDLAEKNKEDLKNKICEFVVKNRHLMWT